MQGEFRGDFTRDTSNRSKHFLRVLMQQGRVQVDADWNEQVDALLHYLHTLAATLIGPYGGPAGSHANFEVIATNDGDSIIDEHNFVIGAGQYYIDGILCELDAIDTSIPNENVRDALSKILLPGWLAEHSAFQEEQYLEILFRENETSDDRFLYAKITDSRINNQGQLELSLLLFSEAPNVGSITNIRIRQLTTYKTQPHLLLKQDGIEDGNYLVYLDVWERHVSHVEDRSDHTPGIREVALGGVDTATRSQVVWQVKLLPIEGIEGEVPEERVRKIKEDMDVFRDILDEIRGDSAKAVYNIIKPGSGQLIARARKPDVGMTDPCTISPESRYRGENQLYRVEVFSTINDEPKFVWSRENSAVTFPILGPLATKSTGEFAVTLEHLGRDRRFSLSQGDLVEIVDGAFVSQDLERIAFKVSEIDLGENRVTLEPLSDGDRNISSFGKNSFLRRWDCSSLQPIDLSKKQGGWSTLENGIEVKFQADDHQSYQVGDYWLIPARTETGDVEWRGSSNNPLPIPPHGVSHHYAPLAIISVEDDGIVRGVKDCRRLLKRSLLSDE